MSRKYRPVERTEPTNLLPNKVQRANHRVPWRSPSTNGSSDPSVDKGRTSGCQCRLGPFGLKNNPHCAFALVSSRRRAIQMTNHGFEIPKWKVILSFPRWMDERGHNESRNSRVARLGVPHDHSLVLHCWPIPTLGASLARPQQQSILTPKAVHCNCCNTMKDDAHCPQLGSFRVRRWVGHCFRCRQWLSVHCDVWRAQRRPWHLELD
jgi:hypothetical protein